MSTRPIRSAALAALVAATAIAISANASALDEPEKFKIENNIDRMGGDYHSLTLAPAHDSYATCQSLCVRAQRCKAFTYVRPNTTQGPHGRCWLLTALQAARSAARATFA